LSKTTIPVETIDRICYIIGHHHTLSKIDGEDFQVIVEADFLVNIFEDEMNEQLARTILDKHFKTKSGKQLLNAIYVA
jgi:hypothetical protein